MRSLNQQNTVKYTIISRLNETLFRGYLDVLKTSKITPQRIGQHKRCGFFFDNVDAHIFEEIKTRDSIRLKLGSLTSSGIR